MNENEEDISSATIIQRPVTLGSALVLTAQLTGVAPEYAGRHFRQCPSQLQSHASDSLGLMFLATGDEAETRS